MSDKPKAEENDIEHSRRRMVDRALEPATSALCHLACAALIRDEEHDAADVAASVVVGSLAFDRIEKEQQVAIMRGVVKYVQGLVDKNENNSGRLSGEELEKLLKGEC